MRYVVCNDEVYNELYAQHHPRFPRLRDCEDLLGCEKMTVIIHADWHTDDENDPGIEDKVEALAMFKYIKLVYVCKDGTEIPYDPPGHEEVGQ